MILLAIGVELHDRAEAGGFLTVFADERALLFTEDTIGEHTRACR